MSEVWFARVKDGDVVQTYSTEQEIDGLMAIIETPMAIANPVGLGGVVAQWPQDGQLIGFEFVEEIDEWVECSDLIVAEWMNYFEKRPPIGSNNDFGHYSNYIIEMWH